MIKFIVILLILAAAGALVAWKYVGVSKTASPKNLDSASNIYGIKLQKLDGSGELDLSTYAGKKILIVNVASECGYTPQYKGLQELYTKYTEKLVIIGCPCNQFGSQEPGDSATIRNFCSKNFGVTFPLSAKLDVKGEQQHALYKWLCNKSENGVLDATVKWNFNKFLIGTDGKLLAYYTSRTEPSDPELAAMIEK